MLEVEPGDHYRHVALAKRFSKIEGRFACGIAIGRIQGLIKPTELEANPPIKLNGREVEIAGFQP
jgi:hypothetical protein